MPKNLYVGVDNVARKCKKMYIGVENLARKVKKGYIGVGGVARPFFTGGELAYYGKLSASMTVAHQNGSSANTGDYALITGNGTTVTTLSKSLTLGTATALSNSLDSSAHNAGGSIGDYAVFGGGWKSSGDTYLSKVEAYNSSLTKRTASNFYCARYDHSAANTSDYLIFGGGSYNYNDGGTGTKCAYYEIYNSSLTYQKVRNGPYDRCDLAATSIEDVALFGGGDKYRNGQHYSTSYSDVYQINNSLTVSNSLRLSASRGNLSATCNGTYAIFAGGTNAGYTGSGTSAYPGTVDAINSSLTVTTLAPLPNRGRNISCAALDGFAVFMGGDLNRSYLSSVDVYDESLTHTTNFTLSNAITQAIGGKVGNYIFSAGGKGVTSYKTIDAFVVE